MVQTWNMVKRGNWGCFSNSVLFSVTFVYLGCCLLWLRYLYWRNVFNFTNNFPLLYDFIGWTMHTNPLNLLFFRAKYLWIPIKPSEFSQNQKKARNNFQNYFTSKPQTVFWTRLHWTRVTTRKYGRKNRVTSTVRSKQKKNFLQHFCFDCKCV